MSKSAEIRRMFLNGEMKDNPSDKRRVAAMFGIRIQTVTQALKALENNHTTKTNVNTKQPLKQDDHSSVKKTIIDKYEECYDIAKQHGIYLDRIPVDFDIRGRVAGKFVYGNRFCFKVNMEIAFHNLEEYLARTVPHEFAHYIVRIKYGFLAQPHGREWKQTMRSVFGLEPTSCHNYNMENVTSGRNIERFKYVCGCKDKIHYITSIRHKRVQIENKKYLCVSCRKAISFKG